MFEGSCYLEAEIDVSDPKQKERERCLYKKIMRGSDLTVEESLWLDAWNKAVTKIPSKSSTSN